MGVGNRMGLGVLALFYSLHLANYFLKHGWDSTPITLLRFLPLSKM